MHLDNEFTRRASELVRTGHFCVVCAIRNLKLAVWLWTSIYRHIYTVFCWGSRNNSAWPSQCIMGLNERLWLRPLWLWAPPLWNTLNCALYKGIEDNLNAAMESFTYTGNYLSFGDPSLKGTICKIFTIKYSETTCWYMSCSCVLALSQKFSKDL